MWYLYNGSKLYGIINSYGIINFFHRPHFVKIARILNVTECWHARPCPFKRIQHLCDNSASALLYKHINLRLKCFWNEENETSTCSRWFALFNAISSSYFVFWCHNHPVFHKDKYSSLMQRLPTKKCSRFFCLAEK